MRFLATVLDILSAGLDGDPQKARVYGELLCQRIQDESGVSEEDQARVVRALRGVLDRDPGQRGAIISPAQEET